jgi:signal transduction histidine kinase
VPVDLHVEGRCSLPLEVKAAFYRIAQESLNNVARHAEAEHVRVSLTCTPDHTGLVIDDDGQGFEPDHLPPDHLGLGIMRERAAQAGAVIHIRSQPGAGTTITVTWTSPTGEMEGEK